MLIGLKAGALSNLRFDFGLVDADIGGRLGPSIPDSLRREKPIGGFERNASERKRKAQPKGHRIDPRQDDALVRQPKVRLPYRPRGMRLPTVAAYVGVSETKFKQWVNDGLMPKHFKIGDVTLWDANKVDSAFDDLPGNMSDAESEWDDLHV